MSCYFTVSATAEIYTLSLHDALPIYRPGSCFPGIGGDRSRGHGLVRDGCVGPGCTRMFDSAHGPGGGGILQPLVDRKSTRLNSSHLGISYAVFCLKKKSHKRSRDATR